MAKANITISENNEEHLSKLMKPLALINGRPYENKEQLINFAIEVAAGLLSNLDDETIAKTINIKKRVG